MKIHDFAKLKILLLLVNGRTANCVGRPRGGGRLSRRGAGRVREGDEEEGGEGILMRAAHRVENNVN